MPVEIIVQIVTLSLIILVPMMLWAEEWRRNGKPTRPCPKPSTWAVIGCVVYTASYFLANAWQLAFVYLEPPHAYGLALRLYTLHALLLVGLYISLIFFQLTRGRALPIDTQARLVWVVVLIFEGWAVLEYVECKLWVDPLGSGDFILADIWGIETSRFACGRRFGWLAPYITPIITSLYLIWINWRAGSIRLRGQGG